MTKLMQRISPTSWLTVKTVFSQGFGLLLFAIQAPLLGPRVFGLISIVMIFVGFCESVPTEAAAEALISIREIDDEHFASMTTVNVALAVVVGVLVFAGAGTVAGWFGDPELVAMMRYMSVLPIISAFAAAPTAATKRNMQFQPLALRSMASILVGGLVGLALTLAGMGVWALVWQAIVTRLVASLVLWYAVPLKLQLGFSRRHLRDLRRFAAPTAVSRVLTWSSSQIPRLLLGLYWGPVELGLFGLAARLCDILMEVTMVPRYAVARVELRRFATDRAGLQQALHDLLTRMSVLCFPLCVGGAAVAPTLFHVWLDARWLEGIVPAELMMLMCVPFVTHYCVGAALLALNYQSAEALVSVSQTVVTATAMLVFAPFGLAPTAAAYAARPVVLLPMAAILCRSRCQIPARLLWAAQRPALIASVIMGIGVAVLRIELEPLVKNIILLPLLIAAGGALYAGAIYFLLPGWVRRLTSRFAIR